MKLYATSLSHYSRKVRILLDLYQVPYEVIDTGNVAQAEVKAFGGNPMMRVPVLVDGENWLIESDHIAKYVVERFDPSDRFRVLSAGLHELNQRAVLNQIMMEEVKLILARRTGLPTEKYAYFDKCKLALENGLDWLEANARFFSLENPGYLEFHLTCLLQHLEYYELLRFDYPDLHAIVAEVLKNPVVARTSPFVLKPKS